MVMSSTAVSITVRKAETHADYVACQAAQRQAWGITADGYVVPVATMVGAQLHGGLVLGAFLPSGEAVGLSFAFLGRIDGRLCLYSQLTGVTPDYQGHGVGFRLKQAQWEYARDQGLELLAWAFDPLQAANAAFNLAKLGAIARRYIKDMYGPRTDALNAGTPTDRLIVEWSTRPNGRSTPPDAVAATAPRLLDTSAPPDGFGEIRGVTTNPTAPVVLLEIPADFNELRRHDPALAERWRLAVRHAFQAAFAAGYQATGFLRRDHEGRERPSYVLEHRGEEP
jgi:predicted GNAT superfamily acetyltransferase